VTLEKFNDEFFPPIVKEYKRLGFPTDLRIIPKVDVAAAEKVTKAVIEKNESENAILTKKLTEKHQQNAQNGKGGVGNVDGPSRRCRSISKNVRITQIVEILEEERSVVV